MRTSGMFDDPFCGCAQQKCTVRGVEDNQKSFGLLTFLRTKKVPAQKTHTRTHTHAHTDRHTTHIPCSLLLTHQGIEFDHRQN